MKNASMERIEKMRNGERLKCPRCENGYIAALGNPKKTKTFSCDICQTAITLTIPYRIDNKEEA